MGNMNRSNRLQYVVWIYVGKPQEGTPMIYGSKSNPNGKVRIGWLWFYHIRRVFSLHLSGIQWHAAQFDPSQR
jgi:hypothetical protein